MELNGYTTLIRPVPAKAHFKDVNILGADFCTLNQVVGVVDYHTRESTLLFKRLLRPKQKQGEIIVQYPKHLHLPLLTQIIVSGSATLRTNRRRILLWISNSL